MLLLRGCVLAQPAPAEPPKPALRALFRSRLTSVQAASYLRGYRKLPQSGAGEGKEALV